MVNFNEDSYAVNESDGQVSISLRIDGKFFVPVWAIVEISNGTATSGSCANMQVKCVIYVYVCIISLNMLMYGHCDCLSADPEDYSSAMRYNVTFYQTALTDEDDPFPTAESSFIVISIMNDNITEGAEYFHARIVGTSDGVRLGPNGTAIVTITSNDG